MENNSEVQYTPEELSELYHLIFMGNKENLILFDMQAFSDTETLKNWINHHIKWTTTFPKKMEQLLLIKELLFCDSSKLPILLNGQLSRIVLWRMNKGK
jgi:hypothetical protein